MDINFDIQTYTRGINSLNVRFGMPSSRELIILFGLMSSGKTEFSYFVARKNAELGVKVMYISLELPEYDMKLRIARKRAGVSKYNFQNKKYSADQRAIMQDQFKKIDRMKNLLIHSPEDKSLGQIIKSMRKAYDLGYRMFIIDNLDKIPGELREDENSRYQRITSTLQDFKNESNIFIMLIHHAKKPENKFGGYKSGGMAGMRGSQKIMDNATQVFEIYRDLDPDCEPSERSRVSITQMKDTFEGANGSVDIYFHLSEYVEENPYKHAQKDDEPF